MIMETNEAKVRIRKSLSPDVKKSLSVIFGENMPEIMLIKNGSFKIMLI